MKCPGERPSCSKCVQRELKCVYSPQLPRIQRVEGELSPQEFVYKLPPGLCEIRLAIPEDSPGIMQPSQSASGSSSSTDELQSSQGDVVDKQQTSPSASVPLDATHERSTSREDMFGVPTPSEATMNDLVAAQSPQSQVEHSQAENDQPDPAISSSPNDALENPDKELPLSPRAVPAASSSLSPREQDEEIRRNEKNEATDAGSGTIVQNLGNGIYSLGHGLGVENNQVRGDPVAAHSQLFAGSGMTFSGNLFARCSIGDMMQVNQGMPAESVVGKAVAMIFESRRARARATTTELPVHVVQDMSNALEHSSHVAATVTQCKGARAVLMAMQQVGNHSLQAFHKYSQPILLSCSKKAGSRIPCRETKTARLRMH